MVIDEIPTTPQTHIERMLLAFEKEVLHPYKDHLGNLTIGIGRCIDKKGISRQEAWIMFRNDIAGFTADVDRALPWAQNIAPNRRDVLIAMAFQMGIDGLLSFRNMLASAKQGQWAEAAAHGLDSAWARTQTPGRANAEMQMLVDG